MMLEMNKKYRFREYYLPTSTYIGVTETPSGLMLNFVPDYSTSEVKKGKPFILQYNYPGIERCCDSDGA